MCCVATWQNGNLPDCPNKQILFGFNSFEFSRARSRFSRCFGLRLGNLLLDVFEILKRLKFHLPILPQGLRKKGLTYKTPCSAMEKAWPGPTMTWSKTRTSTMAKADFKLFVRCKSAGLGWTEPLGWLWANTTAAL